MVWTTTVGLGLAGTYNIPLSLAIILLNVLACLASIILVCKDVVRLHTHIWRWFLLCLITGIVQNFSFENYISRYEFMFYLNILAEAGSDLVMSFMMLFYGIRMDKTLYKIFELAKQLPDNDIRFVLVKKLNIVMGICVLFFGLRVCFALFLIARNYTHDNTGSGFSYFWYVIFCWLFDLLPVRYSIKIANI